MRKIKRKTGGRFCSMIVNKERENTNGFFFFIIIIFSGGVQTLVDVVIEIYLKVCEKVFILDKRLEWLVVSRKCREIFSQVLIGFTSCSKRKHESKQQRKWAC